MKYIITKTRTDEYEVEADSKGEALSKVGELDVYCDECINCHDTLICYEKSDLSDFKQNAKDLAKTCNDTFGLLKSCQDTCFNMDEEYFNDHMCEMVCDIEAIADWLVEEKEEFSADREQFFTDMLIDIRAALEDIDEINPGACYNDKTGKDIYEDINTGLRNVEKCLVSLIRSYWEKY